MTSEVAPVEWTDGVIKHMARHGVTVDEANEAITDNDRIWLEPDPKSEAGNSIRVIGYSPTAMRLLTVILRSYAGSIRLYGANGWPTTGSDRTLYE